MTLLSILIGLALEYFLGALDRIRNFTWFDQYSEWLELRCSHYSIWPGPAGVLLTLAGPLLVLMLIASGLGRISVVITFFLTVFIFVYSLGPELNNLINRYVAALEGDNDTEIREIEERLTCVSPADEEGKVTVIKSILIRAHEHIFGIIFWFIVLGMTGAMLYCLVVRMKYKFNEIHGGYADAIRDLHSLLMWPSARLQALGYALGGSLVDALEGWREVDGYTLDCSEEIIATSGLCAIQFQTSDPDAGVEGMSNTYIECIREAQALVNRTLIVWLTALGIMTLGGWLA
ncbi:MAG: hypothetical protein ACE5GZ_11325 [Gammaproteobacteria bacterium]